MADDTFANWEKFLNPDKLKTNLIQASLYLAAYEIFKNGMIDKLRDFYAHQWRPDATGEVRSVISEAYKKEVIALYPKDELHACCLWFASSGAIEQNDLNQIEKIRKHRNSIAHELPKYVSSADRSIDLSSLFSLIGLVKKIDLWWLKEVDLPTDPDYTPEDITSIDWNKVIGLRTLSLHTIDAECTGRR
ncbi:MAG: hypothetical protein HYZ50_04000 [Deltaproteobacteria bacterium]|nr:hypothetical protein [Deltaproteobacteria bacterium]